MTQTTTDDTSFDDGPDRCVLCGVELPRPMPQCRSVGSCRRLVALQRSGPELLASVLRINSTKPPTYQEEWDFVEYVDRSQHLRQATLRFIDDVHGRFDQDSGE